MTRAGNKIPFPMPQSGIISDQHPFAIGHGGLSLSQNWWNHDGIFITRNGLFPVDPPKRWYEHLVMCPNLVPEFLAEADPAGLFLLEYDSPRISVVAGTANALAGDHQFTASIFDPGEAGSNDVTTALIVAEPRGS